MWTPLAPRYIISRMQPELLYTTFPDIQAAERITAQLLDERLIACANLMPGMTSIYRWQGNIEKNSEVAAFFKTDAAHLEALMARLKAIHPYETPCMLCIHVKNTDVHYLGWMLHQLRD